MNDFVSCIFQRVINACRLAIPNGGSQLLKCRLTIPLVGLQFLLLAHNSACRPTIPYVGSLFRLPTRVLVLVHSISCLSRGKAIFPFFSWNPLFLSPSDENFFSFFSHFTSSSRDNFPPQRKRRRFTLGKMLQKLARRVWGFACTLARLLACSLTPQCWFVRPLTVLDPELMGQRRIPMNLVRRFLKFYPKCDDVKSLSLIVVDDLIR